MHAPLKTKNQFEKPLKFIPLITQEDFLELFGSNFVVLAKGGKTGTKKELDPSITMKTEKVAIFGSYNTCGCTLKVFNLYWQHYVLLLHLFNRRCNFSIIYFQSSFSSNSISSRLQLVNKREKTGLEHFYRTFCCFKNQTPVFIRYFSVLTQNKPISYVLR